MAFPQPPGLLPAEVAFLCEMEQVTVIPRQRLDRLDLLGVSRFPLQHLRCGAYLGQHPDSFSDNATMRNRVLRNLSFLLKERHYPSGLRSC
jgi:hypothetical protein